MTREFYEVLQDGCPALNIWAATFVEKQDPQFRVAPSEHHVFVSTRSTYPVLVGRAGWLDTATHPLRLLKGKNDRPVIAALLQAERRTAEKMEALYQRERALRPGSVAVQAHIT